MLLQEKKPTVAERIINRKTPEMRKELVQVRRLALQLFHRGLYKEMQLYIAETIYGLPREEIKEHVADTKTAARRVLNNL